MRDLSWDWPIALTHLSSELLGIQATSSDTGRVEIHFALHPPSYHTFISPDAFISAFFQSPSTLLTSLLDDVGVSQDTKTWNVLFRSLLTQKGECEGWYSTLYPKRKTQVINFQESHIELYRMLESVWHAFDDDEWILTLVSKPSFSN